MEANTQLLSIKDIVQNNFFKIPDYQRGYSWEEKQLDDLKKDILHIAHKEHKHYTGTIVITKSSSSQNSFEIVDGQQRLTTLIILLKVIYDYDPLKYKEINEVYLLRGNIGNEKLVLETNNETNLFFKAVIIGNKENIPANLKSLKCLLYAKKSFTNWIDEEKDKVDLIYKVVTEKLGFICFAPTNNKEIGIMFEVINNRGKELSELEKIKNYFIYYSTINDKNSLRIHVNEMWGKILIHLSGADIVDNEEENKFLRNCYIVFYSINKKESWYVYDQLKTKYPPSDINNIDDKIKEISKFIDFLLEAAQYYAYFNKGTFFEQDYNGLNKSEIATHLKRLRCHPVNASILPLYLAGMSYLNSDPDFVNEFLSLLEITNFRVYVLPNTTIARADSKQGDLFYWANKLYNDRSWQSKDYTEEYTWQNRKIDGNIFTYIKMLLEDFVIKLCTEETFIQSLTIDADENIDYFNWNDGLRFFLASYEEHLYKNHNETWDIEKMLIKRDDALKNSNDYLSREHIWASNDDQDFPADYKDKRRLGNFVLMGIRQNIQLKNDNIEAKIKTLKDKSSSSMQQINQLEEYFKNAKTFAEGRCKRHTKSYYSDIAIHLIDQRENDLVKFALHRWKLPLENFKRFKEIDSFKAQMEKLKVYYFLCE